MLRKFCLCLLVATLASSAAAQETSALINKALDEQVKLDLNMVLPQAMKAIATQTGVRLEAHPAVWELLPWGRDTNLTVKIENQTLRQALELMTRKLGLTFELRDEHVLIQPVPALQRLARRSTIQELAALDLLAATPLGLKTDRPTLGQVIDAVDAKLVDHKSPVAVENRLMDKVRSDKVVYIPRNATLMGALESLVGQSSATWYPWGQSIVVLTKEDQVRRHLARTVPSLNYRQGQDINQVLLDLQNYAGVPFVFQPGAVQQIPLESRTVKASFENVPLQQVLEMVAASTGLGYVIKDGEVYLWNQATGSAAGGRDPIVGFIQLDNGFQVMLPQSQVPADIRQYLRHKTLKQLDNLRKLMQEEGFKPTTQPAPAPPDNQDL